jgi:C1A family cysteine protease
MLKNILTHKINLFTFVLFLFMLKINYIKTDIPVHCLLKDVQGKWDFKISLNTFEPNLENEQQTSCGHGVPNKFVERSTAKKKIQMPNYTKISIDLRPNFKVYENEIDVGTWSLVYDQSLLIRYKTSVLTAPFKYYLIQGSENADSDCHQTFLGWYIQNEKDLKKNWACFYGEKQNTQLNGGEKKTDFVAFLQIKGKTAKERHENFGSFLENNIAKELKKTESASNKDNNSGFSFAQTKITNKASIENHLKYEQMGNILQKINKLNLGYETVLYPKFYGMSLLQVKHNLGLNKGNYHSKEKDYFSLIQTNMEKEKITDKTVNDYLRSVEKELDEISNEKTALIQTESKTYKNFNSKSKLRNKENKIVNNGKAIGKEKGETCETCFPRIEIDPKNPLKIRKIDPNVEREPDSYNVTSYKEVSKYLNTDIESIDETKLPKNWDWRNVGGKNYLPPIYTQGGCGSCYTFSAISTLEARLRIQTNLKDQTLFSKQYPISCNFYSEGCNGGYPILVAKFSKEFELIPESCFPQNKTTNPECSSVCKDYKSSPKKYTVSDYGYLGGAYGKTTEAQMMKEIRARGPIPGNLDPNFNFQYYRRGIITDKLSLLKNSNVINLKSLFDYGTSWKKVEHSVTLVGYGETEGIKYWIAANTWGEDWGEGGFFRIQRGENAFGIESMGDYMNIKVEDRKIDI